MVLDSKGGIIFDIQRFSLHDGPGIRTLVFLKGCPLKCLWCANPEGISHEVSIFNNKNKCIGCGACLTACKAGAITFIEDEGYVIDRHKCSLSGRCAIVCPTGSKEIIGEYKTAEEIVKIVKRDAMFSKGAEGGITVGGGEALFQPEFTYEILKLSREEKINTAIETSGMGSWNWIDKIAELCDTIFYDLKSIDSEKHKKLTGVGNEIILKNLINLDKKIFNMQYFKPKLIIRMPLVKGYNADKNDILEGAKFIKDNLTSYSHVELLPFHNFGEQKYKKLDLPYEFVGRGNDRAEDCEEAIKIMESMDIPVKVTTF